MDVPMELLLGNEAKGRGGGAVPAPGVKIDELNSPHGQAFSHSLRRRDNLNHATSRSAQKPGTNPERDKPASRKAAKSAKVAKKNPDSRFAAG